MVAVTAPQPATAAAAQTEQRIYLGSLGEGQTETYSVDVAERGRWRLDFFVSYPQTPGLIASVVDGRALPDVISPARPDRSGVDAYTRRFWLRPGTQTFTVTAEDLPSTVGLTVSLLESA